MIMYIENISPNVSRGNLAFAMAVLYGMGFRTQLQGARARYGRSQAAQSAFLQLRRFGQEAVKDLPTHRALVEQVYRDGFHGTVRRDRAVS
jgi:hypothetical protein